MHRFLIVDDDSEVCGALQKLLTEEGYDTAAASDGADALCKISEWQPHLVILDLVLPRVNGYAVLREMRSSGNQRPVLVLSGRADVRGRARAFRVGAHQFLEKPFSPLELVARVESLLGSSRQGEEFFRFSDVEIDTRAHVATKAGKAVHLTPKQFDLLLALIRHRGQVVSRQQLLREVWGYAWAAQTRTVDEHIKQLRRAVEDDPKNPAHILTVWGIGYRFES